MVDISPIDRLSFRIDYQTDYMTALGKQKGIKPLTIHESNCQAQSDNRSKHKAMICRNYYEPLWKRSPSLRRLQTARRNSSGSTNLNTGVVIAVVTNAMITIIENRAGDRSPRSRPTFNTISSTRPRVFNRQPSAGNSNVESCDLRSRESAANLSCNRGRDHQCRQPGFIPSAPMLVRRPV